MNFHISITKVVTKTVKSDKKKAVKLPFYWINWFKFHLLVKKFDCETRGTERCARNLFCSEKNKFFIQNTKQEKERKQVEEDLNGQKANLENIN